MSAIIRQIQPNSLAARKKIAAGDCLLSINGRPINDFLDYEFYTASEKLTLRCKRPAGKEYVRHLRKGEDEDLGLVFAEQLFDGQRHCKNNCVFCFIDQMPKGLRDSLYCKDDDPRLGFLFGNYITLTNLSEADVARIIEMRLSPVNVSVHTMNPDLRVRMMKNPKAGDSLRWLERLASAGIALNIQLVLCPGWNDGAALEESLQKILALPNNAAQSVAAVPVGLTRYRDDLPHLRAFTQSEAIAVLDCFDKYRKLMPPEAEYCCSDEFFLLAGRKIPGDAYYGTFRQIENGVGLWASLRGDFLQCLQDENVTHGLFARAPLDLKRSVTVATGKAAAPLLRFLVDEIQKIWHTVRVEVFAIENRFFGEQITVAGLLTGRDIIRQLQDKPLGDALLLPACVLRHEGDITLDGMDLNGISRSLGNVQVCAVPNGGIELLRAVLGVTEMIGGVNPQAEWSME
ncbi:MAG: DUF512 domain-containing protein [Oscillospiraceae bacterium]|jgi:putative radical SAM enzyme (TIGR03279 family)|nr:DUF512 domain-containing protein [Oscillospiraceae bacterium]